MRTKYRKYQNIIALIIGIFLVSTTAVAFSGLNFAMKDIDRDGWEVYSDTQLSYSVRYPKNWKLVTYPSNDYTAVGLYDPIAQQQDPRIPDLTMGAKIEITANNYIPNLPIKEHLSKRNKEVLNFEQITDVREMLIDNDTIIAVRDEHIFEDNKGVRVSFVNHDRKFYTISLGIPKYTQLDSKKIEEYLTVFEQILTSLKFLKK